jgi:mono/diheme cytochrome c family protein
MLSAMSMPADSAGMRRLNDRAPDEKIAYYVPVLLYEIILVQPEVGSMMKTAPTVLLMTFALAVGGALLMTGCASTPAAEADTAVVAGEVRIYEVFGMDCPGCHGGLENLVEALPGVVAAKASWQENRLSLTVVEGGELSDDTVREAIARAYFSAGERLR